MKNFKLIKLNLLKKKLDYFDYIFFLKLYNINNLKILKNEFNSVELISSSLLKHLNINSKGFFILIYSNKLNFLGNLNLILKNLNIFLVYILNNKNFYNYKNLTLNLLNKSNLVYNIKKKLINLNFLIFFNYLKLINFITLYKLNKFN